MSATTTTTTYAEDAAMDAAMAALDCDSIFNGHYNCTHGGGEADEDRLTQQLIAKASRGSQKKIRWRDSLAAIKAARRTSATWLANALEGGFVDAASACTSGISLKASVKLPDKDAWPALQTVEKQYHEPAEATYAFATPRKQSRSSPTKKQTSQTQKKGRRKGMIKKMSAANMHIGFGNNNLEQWWSQSLEANTAGSRQHRKTASVVINVVSLASHRQSAPANPAHARQNKRVRKQKSFAVAPLPPSPPLSPELF